MLLEIIIAVVFVVFLVLGSIVVINAAGGSSTETETTIENSFNTYNYNIPAQAQYTTLTAKPYFIDDGSHIRVYRNYPDYDGSYYLDDAKYVDNRKDFSDDKRYLRYSSDSELRVVDGLFGNDINRYEVRVFNRDYVGGNFKVVFFFEDYYGLVSSETMTYYVPAREEKLFLIKDISPERYDYKRWWYHVNPITKVKKGNY